MPFSASANTTRFVAISIVDFQHFGGSPIETLVKPQFVRPVRSAMEPRRSRRGGSALRELDRPDRGGRLPQMSSANGSVCGR